MIVPSNDAASLFSFQVIEGDLDVPLPLLVALLLVQQLDRLEVLEEDGKVDATLIFDRELVRLPGHLIPVLRHALQTVLQQVEGLSLREQHQDAEECLCQVVAICGSVGDQCQSQRWKKGQSFDYKPL